MTRPSKSSGFSLVLSLVIMAAMVLMVITLAAFLAVETRLATSTQMRMQARMNALMSARLALAHLQQEAGPDRRVTARGDLACDPTPTSPWPSGFTNQIKIGQGQSYWTGVWRSDKPDQPPAWLISGRGDKAITSANTAYTAQSISLSNATDYLPTQWVPWQTSYPIPGTYAGFVVLVGNNTAAMGPGPDGIMGNSDDVDGRIALPRIPLPGANVGDVTGNYAYWIGDEGVKARINLTDPRLTNSPNGLATASGDMTDVIHGPGRAGTELLTGFKTVAPNAPTLNGVSRDLIYTVTGYNPLDPSALGIDSLLARYHDHSYVAAGVLADAFHGGLKRDLSLAFEMDDAAFDFSEFGAGAGNATEVYATDATLVPPLRRLYYPYDDNTFKATRLPSGEDARLRVWAPTWENNPDNPGRGNPGLSQTVKGYRGFPWSPVYLRDDEFATSPLDGGPRRTVGPLWHSLRDYYRLYKELNWNSGTPSLDARSFYPNTYAFLTGGFTNATDTSYELNHGYWPNGSTDPMGNINPVRGNQLLPRAVRGAYMPIVHRLSLVYSVKRVAFTPTTYYLRLICTPVLVLHNPYNVGLSMRAASMAENDPLATGMAGRISWTRQNGLFFNVLAHANNDPTNPAMVQTSASIYDIYGMTSQSDSENFVSLIPACTLAPGEFRVFSALNLIPATRVNQFQNGLYQNGGFYTDAHTRNWNAATNSPDTNTPLANRLFNANEPVATWFYYTGTSWYHYFYLRSAWKTQLNNDVIAPLGSDLGSNEIISTAQKTSTASLASMIDVGSFGGNKNFHGDPGTISNPVYTPPISQLRDFSEVNNPGPVIAVFDTRIRTADTTRITTYNRDVLHWPDAQASPVPAPNPIFLFSNPLAQSSTVPGNNGMPSIGAPSHRLQVFGGDELLMNSSTNWSNFIEVDASKPNGTNTYGGYSHSSNGNSTYVAIDIPTQAPLSLGQFMHANFTTWDWFNYRTVGNSFPNLTCPLDKAWIHSTPYSPNGLTFPDYSYLMNSALWDGYYFSGAAPRLSDTRNGDYNVIRVKKTSDVLNDFSTYTKPLGNPRMRLYQPSSLPSLNTALADPNFLTPVGNKAPSGYRRLGGYLLNDGAFNVNSTSVEAWTALFGSLKQIGLGSQAASAPSPNLNARAPLVIKSPQDPATRNLRDDAFWSGFANLSDLQISALAKATVDEIKARTKFYQRNERDQDVAISPRHFANFPGGKNMGTPFLGLCEFINRLLGPTKQSGNYYQNSFYTLENQSDPFPALPSTAETNKWMFRSGTLDAAISRADTLLGSNGLSTGFTNAQPINPAISHNWGTAGQRSGMPPGCYFRNLEILDTNNNSRMHTGFGAAGCLTQSALLQVLGPILTNRSDTFTIRAYGDRTNSNSTTDIGATAVLEIIVQRTPEFINPANPPETRLEDATLLAVNKILGRRFKVISAKWIAPDKL